MPGRSGACWACATAWPPYPPEWREPLDGMYELQVTGLPRRWKIAELARQMAETGTG